MKAAKRHTKSAAASRDGKPDAWIDDVPIRFQPDRKLAYEHLVRRVRDVILCVVPKGTTILIVSEGDDDFLDRRPLLGRRALHFPQNEKGGYVGHPANGHAAVAALEKSREQGAQFLVIPANSAWWLEQYPELARHLEQNCFKITTEPGTCDIYGLSDETIPDDRELHLEPESRELRPIRSIAPADQGYQADSDFYFQWGWHGLRCVEQALQAARKETVESILDLPSGHGRVLRMLKARFPDAKLTACDIDRDGVDFCAEVFGATPVYSAHDPADVELPDTYDLIWCGSLLTHLAGNRWSGFLELFSAHLRQGGVLVFTTHGHVYPELLRHDALDVPLLEPERLVREFDRDGFAYQDYMVGPPGYGFSLSSPSWVCRELEQHPRLRLLLFMERTWGNYQDVVACIRVPDDEMEERVARARQHLTLAERDLPEERRRLAEYRRMLNGIRNLSRSAFPRGATVVVVSRGDESLVHLDGVRGWHFPRDEDGRYPGYYPADSAAAIEHLEDLRARGAHYFVLPATAFWWLEHYPEFAQHLESRYPTVVHVEDTCKIFGLTEG